MRLRDRLSEYMEDHEKSVEKVEKSIEMTNNLRPPSLPASRSFRTRKAHSSLNKSGSPSNQISLDVSFDESAVISKAIFSRRAETPTNIPLYKRHIFSSQSYSARKSITPVN